MPGRFVIATFIVMFSVIGCAGPKIMSTSIGSHQTWASIPQGEQIAIRVLSSSHLVDKTRNYDQMFVEILSERIKKSQIYRDTIIISADEPPPTPILLEVRLMYVKKTGWAKRFITADLSGVSAAGRLVDVNNERILITFEESRSAYGGLLNGGGFLTPGAASMNKTLMKWVSEDIVTDLNTVQDK